MTKAAFHSVASHSAFSGTHGLLAIVQLGRGQIEL